jgi:hypothetical protein
VSRFRDDVTAALRALRLEQEGRFEWFGELSASLPRDVVARLTRAERRDQLVFALQMHLYEHFYCPGGARPRRAAVPDAAGGKELFVEQLSEANSGQGSWESGWRVAALEAHAVVVVRDGLKLWVSEQDRRSAGRSLAVGDRLEVRMPKELRNLLPGFYTAVGDVQLDFTEPRGVVRIYWNLAASAAPRFVALATSALNRAGAAFRLKVAHEQASFGRCDSAVVYVPKDQFRPTADVLRPVAAMLAADLQPRTPAFTKPIAPGLGLAEDPGNGESFGLHRCRLLAEAAVHAAERGEEELERRLARVAHHFRDAGVDPERPYLNAGSDDDYVL